MWSYLAAYRIAIFSACLWYNRMSDDKWFHTVGGGGGGFTLFHEMALNAVLLGHPVFAKLIFEESFLSDGEWTFTFSWPQQEEDEANKQNHFALNCSLYSPPQRSPLSLCQWKRGIQQFIWVCANVYPKTLQCCLGLRIICKKKKKWFMCFLCILTIVIL